MTEWAARKFAGGDNLDHCTHPQSTPSMEDAASNEGHTIAVLCYEDFVRVIEHCLFNSLFVGNQHLKSLRNDGRFDELLRENLRYAADVTLTILRDELGLQIPPAPDPPEAIRDLLLQDGEVNKRLAEAYSRGLKKGAE